MGDESTCTEGQRLELRELINHYPDCFALHTCELTGANVEPIHIELTEKKNIRVPERPIPFSIRGQVAEELADLLDRKILSNSTSPYCSPCLIVRKKDGTNRMVADYLALNRISACPAYPIPNCEDILLTMGQQRFFTSLDLMEAYWQLPLDEESSKYTAFAALGRQYQYKVLAMGLCGALHISSKP